MQIKIDAAFGNPVSQDAEHLFLGGVLVVVQKGGGRQGVLELWRFGGCGLLGRRRRSLLRSGLVLGCDRFDVLFDDRCRFEFQLQLRVVT